MVGSIALTCALAPLIGRYDPNLPDINVLNQAPSGTHWLGTDDLGRDLWARLLWGGRVSLPAGVEIVGISFIVGVPLGMLAGFGGRLPEELIMRFVDLLLAVPGLLLAIAIVAVLGTGMKSVVIGLGIAGIPGYARVARAATLQLKTMDYVEAARAAGAGGIRILLRHVLPNILDPLVILATLNLSGAILAAAALSFLGIGTQLPDADWGTLLSAGYEHMFLSATELIFPAIVIVVSVLGINLIGDALGDALNPKSLR
jgi:peptide/nickel transport system permease protein